MGCKVALNSLFQAYLLAPKEYITRLENKNKQFADGIISSVAQSIVIDITTDDG